MTAIYDIAKKVGCAPSSVSKYITKHGYVSQALGEKIAQAMVDLDYHYNGLARNLSNGTNNRIGVIVPFLSHPYFQQLITAISKEAVQRGKEVVIMPTAYNAEKEKAYLEELEHNLVGSLIITSHALPIATCNAYSKFGPVVFCKDANDTPDNCITTNRERVYEEVFKKLKHLGKSHIGLLFIRTESESLTTAETLEAYRQVFKANPPKELVRYAGHTFEDGAAAMEEFHDTDSSIQAVLTESDVSAAGAVKYARSHKIPVIVIGQGNQLISKLLNFSSIDQHLTEIGQKAVALATETAYQGKSATVKFDIHWR